jgi:hypothetical protein
VGEKAKKIKAQAKENIDSGKQRPIYAALTGGEVDFGCR